MSHKPNCLCATVFESSLGWFAVTWNGPTVVRLTFGHPTRDGAIHALDENPTLVPEGDSPDPGLVARLKDYADGANDDFSDVVVDTSHLPPFGRRVVKACRRIPYGRTASYSSLAEKAGSPNAARAVGRCMAANRVPLIIPCHRVVGAGGRLGGFSAPGGVRTKRRLLDLEAIHCPAD